MWGCVCSRRSLDRTHCTHCRSVRVKIGDQKRLFQRWFQTGLVVSAHMFQHDPNFSGDDPNWSASLAKPWNDPCFRRVISGQFWDPNSKKLSGCRGPWGIFQFISTAVRLSMPRAPVSHDPGCRLKQLSIPSWGIQTNTIIINYTVIHALHIYIYVYIYKYIIIHMYIHTYFFLAFTYSKTQPVDSITLVPQAT